jgi:hypothetical protein
MQERATHTCDSVTFKTPGTVFVESDMLYLVPKNTPRSSSIHCETAEGPSKVGANVRGHDVWEVCLCLVVEGLQDGGRPKHVRLHDSASRCCQPTR